MFLENRIRKLTYNVFTGTQQNDLFEGYYGVNRRLAGDCKDISCAQSQDAKKKFRIKK